MPALPQRVLAVQPPFVLHGLTPVGHHPLEIGHGVGPRRLHQEGLRSFERLRVAIAGRGQHTNGRHRDLTGFERGADASHPIERTRHPHVLARDPPGDPEPRGEPGGRRQVPVALEQPAPVDL
jgi:hypothetical protein